MHSLRLLAVGSIAALVLGIAPPAAAATIIIDDFNDGTTMGWTAGGGPQQQLPLSSPTNPGDYLLLQSNGAFTGPGSRLTAFNDLQWAGDYVAAGITSVTMDVNNLGQADLLLRLAFYDTFSTLALAYTTAAIPVISGGGWNSIEFSLLAASMTLVGATTLEDVLDSVVRFRIYHSTDETTGLPTPIAGALGIDNIGAQSAPVQVPVPEPATLWLVSAGALVALRNRRRLRAVARRND